MYTFFITIFAFIVAIITLVAIHEYGHFIVARLCNVKVLKFSLGFGPALYKRKDKKGTEFILAPIPLGGYVKMLDKRETDVSPIDNKYEFTSKKPWQKMAIVAAGPIFNFILAFVVFYIMFCTGVSVERPVIYEIANNTLASKAGMVAGEEVIAVDENVVNSFSDFQLALSNRLGTSGDLIIKTKNEDKIKKYILYIDNWQADINKEPISRSLGIWLLPQKGLPLLVNEIFKSNANLNQLEAGDIITSFDNEVIEDWDNVLNKIKNNPMTKFEITILRKGFEKNFSIITGEKIADNIKIGHLGILFSYPIYRKTISYNLIEAISKSYQKTVSYIYQTFYMLYKVVAGEVGVESVRGPVMVAKVAGIQMQLGLSNFLDFLGIISIGLGVINLLPIPVLDGGHLVYHSYEWITGRTFSEFAEKVFVLVGIIVLLMIMSIAFYNDFTYW